MLSPDTNPALAADALTELFVWSHYAGHADPSAVPPAVDLVRLAALVRLVILVNSRLCDDGARRLAERVEVEHLRANLTSYEKKLVALRRELAKARGEGAPAAESEGAPAARTKQPSGKQFRFPEDDYREGKRGRPPS